MKNLNILLVVFAVLLCAWISNAQTTVCNNPSPDIGLRPLKITASRDQGASPCALMDNNLSTTWAASTRDNGELASLTFEFHEISEFDQVQIAFSGDARSYKFDIQISNDGISWSTVLLDMESERDVFELQNFNIGNQSGKYLRYVGKGSNHLWSSQKDWNKINEIGIVSTDGNVPPSGDCDAVLLNEEGDIVLSPSHLNDWGGSTSSIIGITNESSCALRLEKGAGGSNYDRLTIPIELKLNGNDIDPGEKLNFSIDGRSDTGSGRVYVNANNGAGKVADYSFGQNQEWVTYNTEITIPEGVTKLNIWLYPNANSTSAGSFLYDNLKISIVGENQNPPNPNENGFWVASQNGDGITYGSNVGIGVTNPDAPLTVKGWIHSTEIKVDLDGALVPDYVFLEDFELRTLEEVENFIKENGHLPNIKSAEEFQKEGMKLKLMNLKLLEKIEELTLYIIDIDKEIKEIKTKIINQDIRIVELEQLRE